MNRAHKWSSTIWFSTNFQALNYHVSHFPWQLKPVSITIANTFYYFFFVIRICVHFTVSYTEGVSNDKTFDYFTFIVKCLKTV